MKFPRQAGECVTHPRESPGNSLKVPSRGLVIEGFRETTKEPPERKIPPKVPLERKSQNLDFHHPEGSSTRSRQHHIKSSVCHGFSSLSLKRVVRE